VATSGSYNYSVTAGEIIQAALEDIGVLAGGETPSSEDQAMALQRLNFLAKQWQGTADLAQGLKVWTRQRVTLFLAVGQQTYLVGPASTDARATTQFGRTTLSADEAASQTVLSITSNTDTTTYPGTTVTMTASDIIGIVLDDGTIQWTTISGTPASTATVAVALTGAASAGNYVYWFTSRAQRFPVLESARLQDENRSDLPLTVYREAAAYDQGVVDKYADGDPTSLLVEPLRIATRVTLDSQPTDVTKQVWLTALYPAEDYDATSNDIAFPQEWFAALEWELAFRLAPAFGRVWTESMKANHQVATAIARQGNPETSDAYFQVGGL
jgi:hypothetical protein